MVDQSYHNEHLFQLDHPSYIGNDFSFTPKVGVFPKKSYSIREPPVKSQAGFGHQHKFFLETYKNSKLKLTPSLCVKTCHPVKAIRKATTQSVNEYSSPSKPEKKLKHTIKQIYDQEIFFDYDKVIECGELNTVYELNNKKIYIISVLLFILLWMNIAIAVIENVIHVKQTQRVLNEEGMNIEKVKGRKVTVIENVLRIVNLYIGLIGGVFIIVIYVMRVEIMKEDKYVGKNDTIFSCDMWKPCFIKAFLVLLAPPPFVNGIFIIGDINNKCTILSINSIFCTFVLFKACFIVNLIRLFSYYSDNASKSICNNYLVKHTVLFSVKSYMNKHSLPIALTIFLYTLLSFSIIILNFEYCSYDHGILKSNITTLLNAMWISFSVITTLSIGDYYPITFIGNAICLILGIIGLYTLTIIFFAFSDFSHFSFNEQKSYIKLKKITSGENKESKAGSVIQLMLRIRKNIMIYHNFKKDKGSVSSVNISNNSGDGNANPHDTLLTLFGMICLFKVSLTQFKNECKIAKNLGIPVDELITNTSNNYGMNVDVCVQLMDKLKYINNDLEVLIMTEDEIQRSLEMIEKMQSDLENYLIHLNNEKVLYKLREKTINKHNFHRSNTNLIGGSDDERSRTDIYEYTEEHSKDNLKNNSLKITDEKTITSNNDNAIIHKVIHEEDVIKDNDNSESS